MSFNSFIPKFLEGILADKLADYYLNRLAENPDMHDKVEFEILFSCYTFNLKEKLQTLLQHGFESGELDAIAEALRGLTNGIIDADTGLWRQDIQKIETLKERRKDIIESNLDLLSKIYWLIEDCKRYGTLPFAGLARAGFIAVQILASLVETRILRQEDYHNFMAGLDSLGRSMTDDMVKLGRPEFICKYGHLRPGTYDILSPRYDEAPDLYFPWDTATHKHPEADLFKLSLEQYATIENEMNRQGLNGSALSLFRFIQAAIEGREYSKFVFTQSLSDAILLLEKLGSQYGFSREDMSYCNVSVISSLYGSSNCSRRT